MWHVSLLGQKFPTMFAQRVHCLVMFDDVIDKFPKPDLIRFEMIFCCKFRDGKNTTDEEILWICWSMDPKSLCFTIMSVWCQKDNALQCFAIDIYGEDWKQQRLGKDNKKSFLDPLVSSPAPKIYWYSSSPTSSNPIPTNCGKWYIIYYIVPSILFDGFLWILIASQDFLSLCFKVVMSKISSTTCTPYQQHATPLLRSWPMPVWSLGVTHNVEVTVDMWRWLPWNTLKVLGVLSLRCGMMELRLEVDGCEGVFFCAEACWYDMLMLFILLTVSDLFIMLSLSSEIWCRWRLKDEDETWENGWRG